MVQILRKEGWILNPNDKAVNAILKRVEINNGECPCDNPGTTHEDRCCPCKEYRENDICHCSLYIKEKIIMKKLNIPIVIENGAEIPEYATPQSAGADVRCLESFTLNPGERKLVHTGIKIAVPDGYECQVRPRSGLAVKHGITVLNTPGTIDADYRGECCVLLINMGSEPYDFIAGERIAQFVISPVVHADWDDVLSLDQTERGEGGFGHTGTTDIQK